MRVRIGVAVLLPMLVVLGFSHSAYAKCKPGSCMQDGKCIKVEAGQKCKPMARLKNKQKMTKESCLKAGGKWQRKPAGNQFSCGVSQPM